MKKILSIAIALVMLLGIMPTVVAKEANTYKVQYFQYDKDDSLYQLDNINISNKDAVINEGESYTSKLSPKSKSIEIDSLVVIMGENTPIYPTKNNDGSYDINIPKVTGNICIAISVVNVDITIVGGRSYNYYITNLSHISSKHCNNLKKHYSDIATTQIKNGGANVFTDEFTPDAGYEIVDFKVTTSDNFNNNQRDITNDKDVVTKNDDGSYTVTVLGGTSIYVTATAKLIGSSTTEPTTTEPKPVQVQSIRLNKSKTNIEKGTFETLKAVVTPSNAVDKGIIWSSSDVVAAGIGSCVITATSRSNSNVKATCNVTVSTFPRISSTNVSLKSGVSKTIKVVGGTVKSWTSSHKKVATVNKGKITALNKGTSTVTATLTTGKKLTCKVTVTTAPRLSKTTVKVKKGGTATVKVSGKVATINNKYRNTKVAKITSKTNDVTLKIKGLKKGTTTLKIKVNGVKTLNLKVNVK